MNIAFFSNQFASSQGHGIRRYSLELVAALQEYGAHNIIPVAGWSDRADLQQFTLETGLELTHLGRQGTRLAWTFLNWPRLENRIGVKPDIVHAASLGYPIATKKPLVVTIHDLGPLTQPQYFRNTKPWVMAKALRQVERQADQIICVSQSTADEVSNYVGSHIESRISVVHEAPHSIKHLDSVSLDKTRHNLPAGREPFILMAGKISPRKNVQGVLKSLFSIADEIPHHIVLVGGAGWDTREVINSINNSAFSKRIHLLGFVSDTELAYLYKHAALYIHPSLYEGFGLTVLEAMSYGAPVITSNTSSLPEIAGEAALLVDPQDEADISEAILSVCKDEALGARLSERGMKRANEFSWRRAAEETQLVYDRTYNA